MENPMTFSRRSLRRIGLVMTAMVVCAVALTSASAQNIVDEWASVKAPPPPELKPVAADVKTTALLLLDFGKQNCGVRPRCVASVPKVQKFADEARSKEVLVVHSFAGQMTEADLLVPLKTGEPSVRASVDKFLRTDLEKILKDKGIQTVIVTGTAAHGAVLSTAIGSSVRGFKVVVPVDAISSDQFSEMYTVWHLANGPGGVGPNTTITRMDMIKF
jgi:nicotinamidase-related amidase